MNEIVNEVLLAEGKFMPEMHLRHPTFMDIACGPFTKNKKRVQKFNETRDSICIYQNKSDKALFQHDMSYGNFNDLPRKKSF